jgi:type I restriction enzyme S subunit
MLEDVVDINPSRPLQRGMESTYVAMDDLEVWQRQINHWARREFSGSGSRFKNGDTLLARITPCLENGKTAFTSFLAEGEVANGSTEFIVLSGRQNVTDSLFVYYLARSETFREFAIQRMEGSSGRQRVPSPVLANFHLKLPPLSEQRAIASVLGSLDDKIELNRRMNETLEALAQSLFKAWSVDAAQGGQPKGWRAGTLGEVAENPRRGIQPDEIKPDTAYIGLEHMPRRCIALSDWGHTEELESGKFEFKSGEILFGKLRPYFHKVGVAPLDGVCSTDILVITPKEPAWFGFVLGHVSSVELVNHTNAASTGTKMPRANWNDISRYKVALPPKQLAADFTEKIHPLVERIIANIHEFRTLAALRDALLPKLLSGELRMLNQ